MSLYGVEARVVAKRFDPERFLDDAVRLLDDGHELASPDLMWAEISNVLWKEARAGQLQGREAARITRALDKAISRAPSSTSRDGKRSPETISTGRSVYDSVYLALAVAFECRLVTADEGFADALAGGPLAAHVLWVGRPEQTS